MRTRFHGRRGKDAIRGYHRASEPSGGTDCVETADVLVGVSKGRARIRFSDTTPERRYGHDNAECFSGIRCYSETLIRDIAAHRGSAANIQRCNVQ